MKRASALLALGLAAAGCALGPNYRRPDTAVPSAYTKPGAPGETLANLPWWQLFQDPVLQGLIETALRENQDLAIAAWRIVEARARLGIAVADQLPTVTASGGAARGRVSENILPGVGVRNDYFLAGQVSYEADLWGRYRRSTESAQAQLLATEEARRVVIFTLVSDVASLYFQLRDLDAKLEISKRTLLGRTDSVRLVNERFRGGVVPQLDVRQAEIEEGTAAAAVPTFERQITTIETALSLLLGRYPGPIPRGRPLEDQVLPPEVPPGLPSELLSRRPDVRQTEHALHAQMANIGVAEALRFPSFSLTGAIGLESTHGDDLFKHDGLFWNFGASVLQTVFDYGRNRRRVEVEKARTEQAILEYQKAVRQAVADVENALVAIRTFRSEREVRLKQLGSARSLAGISRSRYDGGVADYLEVLDAERSLFNTELEASTALKGQVVAVVALYKALGGGWGSETPQPAPASPEKPK